MINFLIKPLIIFIFFTVSVLADKIDEIEVEGNKRISKESIIIFSEIKQGLEYTNDVGNNSLKKLYDTNFFENVEISFSNRKLFIKVLENPIIEEMKIIGIKNKTFLEFIKERMKLSERSSFNDFDLKNDLRTIDDILKINGYYFSNVNVSFDKNEDLNSLKLKIEIDLGEKAKVKNISFLGNKVFKDKKLLEVIATEEHKFWKFVSKNVYLNKSLIDLDKRLLTNYYKNRGYYEVKILDNYVELDKENLSFNLVYNIDAGSKFIINELSLTLPDDYEKQDFNNILKTFEDNKNEVYSLEFINQILDSIENIASNKSYDFIDLKVEENKIDNNKLNFNFVVADSKKFYIEKIDISGNYTTIEEVIRNKLIIDEGDPLNKLLYNKNIENIKALRIFKDVKSKIKDGSNQNLKIIELNVEEQPTGEIMLAAGAGTNGVTIGGGIKEKNFAGRGITLNTDIEITEETLRGKLVYSQPNFAYTDNSLTTAFESTSTDRLTDFGYKVSKTGLSIGTGFEQYENFFYNPELSLSFEDLETNSTASNNLKKQEGDYTDLYFNYSLSYDKTNSRYEPSAGSKINFYQELPLVSDNNEIINTFVYTKYKSLNPSSNMVGKASIYLKSVNSFDDNDVRISKRAFVPYHRLRGFEKGKIGPIENSDYIGGNYIYTANLSTNLPQLLTTVENLDFSYFIDAANVWGVDYDSTINNSNKIRTSTGIAMDILTVVGPLTLSYSVPITKESTDKTENFRFNIGTSF